MAHDGSSTGYCRWISNPDVMTGRGEIGGWSFESKECTVRKHLLREEFRVTDSNGGTVLTTERKVAEGKATFPFRYLDGNVVFLVDSGRTDDIAGEYTLVEAETNDPKLVLSKEFSFRRHRWTIERPNGEKLAKLASRRGVNGAVNTVVSVLSPFPHTFSVTAPNGEHIGAVSGRFDPRTISDVTIERPGAIPRTTLTAGTVAVAVLESV